MSLTRTAWCDDGAWTLARHLLSLLWNRKRAVRWPPAGFVGRGSSLSAGGGALPWKLSSVAIRRLHVDLSTWPPELGNPPRWRLICGWETNLQAQLHSRSGAGSARSGKEWLPGGDGVAISPPEM